MLTGNPPYEGANFMEILHKKANTMPAPLSTVRPDVPAQLEALIMRAMAKDPAQRPPTMEAFEKELQNVAMLMFSNFSSVPLVEPPDPSPPAGVLGALPGVAAAGGLLARVRGLDRRTKAVVAAGAAVGLAFAFIWVGRASHPDSRDKGMIASAPVVTAPPPVAVPVPPPTPPVPPVTTTPPPSRRPSEDKPRWATARGREAGRRHGRRGKDEDARSVSRRRSGADGKKLLADANRMLRAERFAEARDMFEKLTKSKRERGQALVGLAEIAFQEKKYADAARSAELAADRGGGVKARVLLGDAHFRLARYKEAARAYQDALKIDPGNASAKSGLALANKRM